MGLFRQEAVSHQSERLMGAIVLTQPLSMKVTVGILISVALSIVLFIFNAEYTRKETVRGFLVPNKGMIKSFAHQGGTVEKIWIKEGENVTKNQSLVTLVFHQKNAEGKSLNIELTKRLSAQILLLNNEIALHRTTQSKEKLNLNRAKSGLETELIALQEQLFLADERLSLLVKQQNDVVLLNENGFASSVEIEHQQQNILEAKQEKQNITRLLAQHRNQINQIGFEITNLPELYMLKINQLLRQKAGIENQLAQMKSNHRHTISASHSGTVTGIQIVEGETLSTTTAQSKPLLHILPENSALTAELLLPTRSAGFIKKGLITRLRFDAFPYQRFGFLESEITRIDRALVSPNEVRLPIAFNEPVYRLGAKLSKQKISAYGQSFNLQSGMQFEADILLEKRSLIEWLLEPLYSLKGRVG